MEDTQGNNGATLSEKFNFLGESPWAWAVFIAAVVIWLYIWGRMVHYLAAEVPNV